MKIANVPTFLLFAGLSLSLSSQAQLVNFGEIYVAPEAKLTLDIPLNNQGNWHNEGEIILSKGIENAGVWKDKGTMRFEGAKVQNIQGKLLANHLIINAPVNIDGDLAILNSLTFQQGHLTGIVQFDPSATHRGMSSESHVVGEVVREGDTPFIFPVGDGKSLRSLELIPSKNQSIGVSVVSQDPTVLSKQIERGLTQLDSDQFWVVKSNDPKSEIFTTYDRTDTKTVASLQNGVWRKTDGKISVTTPGGQPIAIGKEASSYMRLGVWPNPTQGEYSLKLEGFLDENPVTIEVVSAEGRRISFHQGSVKNLRGVYQLPKNLVTSQLTIRVLYEDYWWSEKLIFQP